LEIADFLTGPKRHAGRHDEIITAVEVPLSSGPETFAKVGTRNAMVIAVAGLALRLDPEQRAIRAAIGSAAPTVRAIDGLEQVAAALPWDPGTPLDPVTAEEFAARVTACAAPIDDVRGSAAYRLHALGVLARRTLAWVWHEHLKEIS
jgi:CO/xanthine dehydrogenase FAD-binding subunit